MPAIERTIIAQRTGTKFGYATKYARSHRSYVRALGPLDLCAHNSHLVVVNIPF